MEGSNNVLEYSDQDLEVQSETPLAGLTNKDLILETLERTEVDNGGTLSNVLNDPLEEGLLLSDYGLMLTFIGIVKSHEENNQNYLPTIEALETDIVRCLDLSNQGQAAELTPENFATFSNIFNGLREFNYELNNSRDQFQNVMEDGRNALAGGATALAEHAAGLSENQSAALYGTAFLAILWAYTSKTKTAGYLRSAIHYAGLGVLGLYVANAGSQVLTGDSILGNLQRLNRRNNDSIAEYFGLDPSLSSSQLTINALLDSAMEETKLANDTSFGTMIAAYSPSSRTLPDSIYAGTTSFDSTDKQEALHDAVGLIYEKYGPGSELNTPGSVWETRWSFAMENPDVSWQQGIFSLMAPDPNAPDLYPTYTESAMDFIGHRAELVASPVVTWSMETFDAVVRRMPGEALGFTEAIGRLAPGGERLTDFIDIQISSPEQITALAGQYGRFAYAALNSNNQNHIFEDSSGVAYTTVNLPINDIGAVDETLRHLKLVDAYVTAFRRFKREYPEDDNLADHINILFGARDHANGTHTISFAYCPEGSLARDNELLAPRAIDAEAPFGFNSFSPAEKTYALSFYQCDEPTYVDQYEPYILENMPENIDTVREKFDYIFSRDNREAVLTEFGDVLDQNLLALHIELERVGIVYADQLSDPFERTLFYNSIVAAHSTFTNPYTRHLVGLSETSTNEEIIAGYDAYLENYFIEFNSTNFGNLILLRQAGNADETALTSAINSSDRDFEMATQEYFDALCDLDRTSPPDNVPEMTWSLEYLSSEPFGSASVESFEMIPDSVLFLGQGTTLACNNNIVANWYREKVYRNASGQIVNFDSVFTLDPDTNTFTASQDLYLNYNPANPNLQKGVRISGNIYYYMQF
jgi:hypothetical protein